MQRAAWGMTRRSRHRRRLGPLLRPGQSVLASAAGAVSQERLHLGSVERQAGVAEVLAERRQADAAMHRLGAARAFDAVEHLGLGLEHLILAKVLERAVG